MTSGKSVIINYAERSGGGVHCYSKFMENVLQNTESVVSRADSRLQGRESEPGPTECEVCIVTSGLRYLL